MRRLVKRRNCSAQRVRKPLKTSSFLLLLCLLLLFFFFNRFAFQFCVFPKKKKKKKENSKNKSSKKKRTQTLRDEKQTWNLSLCLSFVTRRTLSLSFDDDDDDDDDTGTPFVCLHVAEKPSLAKSIAALLSSSVEESPNGIVDFANNVVVVKMMTSSTTMENEKRRSSSTTLKTRKSSTSIDVHEFSRPFLNRKECAHRFTSVAGHVCAIDFPERFQDWELDPKLLFDCATEKKVTAGRVRV